MKRFLSLLLCLLLLSGCTPVSGESAADDLQLFAINVGKADCLLLSCGDAVYMVDTGTAASWGAVSAALKMLSIDRLTGVIVTHTDNDHAGGATALAASSIQVDAWYASAYYAGVKSGKHPVVSAAALRDQSVHWLKSGDTLPFGSGTLTVLGPLTESDVENCNSVVLLAEGGGGSMLLAGDMEFPEEDELLDAGLLHPVNVLKVGNHAESDATSDAFARTVRPELAIISTSTNEEPDTPAGRVLRALKNAGADIYITQESEAGLLVTLHNGSAACIKAAYNNQPPIDRSVQLTAKDNKRFTTTVTNTSDQAVDVSGWFIHSERGNELFIFPAGSIIAPGQQVTITCLSSKDQGDYLWPQEKVWHKSKSDPGALYDVYGRLINRVE